MTKSVDTTNDFNFAFEDELLPSEADTDMFEKEAQARIEQIEQLQTQNREIMKKITVLLTKLKANPEKVMIKWPNRTENIDKFLEELNEIYKGVPIIK